MGAFALTDAYAYVHGFDYTGEANNILMTAGAESLPSTPFRSGGFKRVTPGLASAALDMQGFWGAAATQSVDSDTFAELGLADRVVTMASAEAQAASPVSILGVEVAYLFRAVKLSYEMFDQVGTVAPFTLKCPSSRGEGVVRGHLLKMKGTVSGTGLLGAVYDTLGFGVAAGQVLYTTFHDFVPGTTITVQVQSDDNVGFSSATTIGTHGPITVSSGSWLTIPGPITDRYLRFNVSAVTGTHTVAAAMAIR